MIRSGMPSPDAKAMCKVVKVTVSDDKIISDLNCMNMDTEFKRHFEAVFTEIGYEATATSITLVNGQLRTATQIVKMTCVGDCD